KGHIKVMRKGGPDSKKAARSLAQCRKGRRCETEACDVCKRRFRKQLLQAAAEIIQSRPCWVRESIIPAGMAFPSEGLNEVDLSLIIKRVRKRLERSKLLADRIVLGGIDISLNLQDGEIEHWQLHLYLLIEGNDTEAVKKAIRKAFPPE